MEAGYATVKHLMTSLHQNCKLYWEVYNYELPKVCFFCTMICKNKSFYIGTNQTKCTPIYLIGQHQPIKQLPKLPSMTADIHSDLKFKI